MSFRGNDSWLNVITDVYDIVQNKDIGFIRTLANTLDVRALYQVDLRTSNEVRRRNKQQKNDNQMIAPIFIMIFI